MADVPLQQDVFRSVPLVSVVIACFNCERFICKAIDSVLAQTVSDLEVIVVDDASTDRSSELVEEYSDSRVRLLRNPTNAGPSRSRNMGMAAARGEWIAILDGDDWFEIDRLSTLISFANSHEADVVTDDLHIIFDGEGMPRSTWFRDYEVPVRSFEFLSPIDLVNFEIGVMKAIFRRSIVTVGGHRYDESVKYGEDFLIYLSMLLGGARFVVYPSPMYYLRRGNTGSLTTNHVALVERVLQLNLSIALRPDVMRDSGLKLALDRRIAGLRRLLRYHSLVYPLRSGQLKVGVLVLLRDPGVFVAAARHIWSSGLRKLRRLAQ